MSCYNIKIFLIANCTSVRYKHDAFGEIEIEKIERINKITRDIKQIHIC